MRKLGKLSGNSWICIMRSWAGRQWKGRKGRGRMGRKGRRGKECTDLINFMFTLYCILAN